MFLKWRLPFASRPSFPASGCRWGWWASPWLPPACWGAWGTCRRPCSKPPAAVRTSGSQFCCAFPTCEGATKGRMRRCGGGAVLADRKKEAKRIWEKQFCTATHLRCQKKKCPIRWLVRAFLRRKRARGLSRYCSYFSTWKSRCERTGREEVQEEVERSHVRLQDTHLQLRLRMLNMASLKCKGGAKCTRKGGSKRCNCSITSKFKGHSPSKDHCSLRS